MTMGAPMIKPHRERFQAPHVKPHPLLYVSIDGKVRDRRTLIVSMLAPSWLEGPTLMTSVAGDQYPEGKL